MINSSQSSNVGNYVASLPGFNTMNVLHAVHSGH